MTGQSWYRTTGIIGANLW